MNAYHDRAQINNGRFGPSCPWNMTIESTQKQCDKWVLGEYKSKFVYTYCNNIHNT